MADPNLDEINIATRKDIVPGIMDNYFKSGPVMAWMKKNRLRIFNGGTKIQENMLYAPTVATAYPKGGQFNITRRQTKLGLLFDMKFYYSNVTEFPEDTEVFLRTPAAAFDTIKTDLANAAMSLSEQLEVDIMRNGQNIGGVDRTLFLNGFEEALNNGVDNSFFGNKFPIYGEQARADTNGAMYPAGGDPNSPGLVADNVAGAITNRVLEQSYQSAVIGDEAPKMGITTNRCMGFINENYMPLQRLVDTKEPTIGWPGIKFKDSTIVVSQYMFGRDGKRVGQGAYVNYLADGETFLWFNPGGEGDDAYCRLHMSASPKYQFGFTGFKVAQDSTMVAGQTLAALNFSVRAIRLMRILFGITN